MKTAAAIIGTLVLGVLSACGSGETPPSLDLTPAPLVSAPATGLVKGRLLRVGGPAPGKAVPLAGTLKFKAADGAIATTNVGAAGRYAIRLAPGDYRITGTSPSIDSGATTCTTAVPITTLKADADTVADVICSVP